MGKFLEMAQRHYEQDQLAQGDFDWDGSAACSVGCFNHELGHEPGDFAALSEWSGIPEWAHQIQEAVFEGLPLDEARTWRVDFARAAEAVTDWDAKYHHTMIGILKIALPHDPSGVVQRVMDLHERSKGVTGADWRAARDAAGAVAELSLRDVATAAGSARQAAWSARDSALAAVWATGAREAADAAARAARWAVGAATRAAGKTAGDAWDWAAGAAAGAAAWRSIASSFLEPA